MLMARLSREQLSKLKKQYGVDTLWSFSRYNSWKTDKYSYMLNYIRHIPSNVKESIYGKQGGQVHDILESFYLGKIKYEDMIDRYEEALFELNTEGYKYSKNDKDMNENISKKYEDSIRHFFMNYKPIEGKVMCEKFIIIKVRDYYFQGYIDFMYKDKSDGKIVISDFKTSTIYTGEKAKKESAQLLLYALGVSQKMNIPIEQIKCNWNFLKYVTVTSDLKSKNKDGSYKTKSKNCLRTSWVKESSGNIRKWIQAEGYDELETEDILQTCIEKNSLDDYPNIEKHFKLSDCYVYIDLTQENIDRLCDEIDTNIKKIEEDTETTRQYLDVIKNSADKNEIAYYEKLIDELWWVDISQKDTYYYFNLCGYDRRIHKPWDEYLKDSEMFSKKEEDNTNNTKKINNNDDLDDFLNWD